MTGAKLRSGILNQLSPRGTPNPLLLIVWAVNQCIFLMFEPIWVGYFVTYSQFHTTCHSLLISFQAKVTLNVILDSYRVCVINSLKWSYFFITFHIFKLIYDLMSPRRSFRNEGFVLLPNPVCQQQFSGDHPYGFLQLRRSASFKFCPSSRDSLHPIIDCGEDVKSCPPPYSNSYQLQRIILASYPSYWFGRGFC